MRSQRLLALARRGEALDYWVVYFMVCWFFQSPIPRGPGFKICGPADCLPLFEIPRNSGTRCKALLLWMFADQLSGRASFNCPML